MLGMYGKKDSMERQNSNGLIKNFKRECQSENVSKALRITFLGLAQLSVSLCVGKIAPNPCYTLARLI